MSVSRLINSAELVVVGAGLFGLTIAESAARELGARVLIVERRPHIGGNAHSQTDSSSGIEVHTYGSHIFHTSNQRVIDYVQRFTQFNSYRHTVWAHHDGRIYSLPFSLATLASYYGQSFTPNEAREKIASVTRPYVTRSEKSLHDKALSSVGPDLYAAFIEGYTWKQWDTDPRDLPASIISRIPVRFDFNNRYFSDSFEGIPLHGYHSWFDSMADCEGIEILLNHDYFALRHLIDAETPLVYSGAIDAYFDYAEGELGWRTLDFELEWLEVADFQGTSVVNYVDRDVPYTRIHEFKHYHPERNLEASVTAVMREYSRRATRHDEPYYPVNAGPDRGRLLAYRDRAQRASNVVFGGRLGSYAYLDMHMAIASALQVFDSQVRDMIQARRVQ